MDFCIRDDDTSFFTSPEDLDRAYGQISTQGPVSLAVIPFCRAGVSKAVPEKYRNRWTVHPLHENRSLVSYLRQEIADGRFEAMLHGYYHEEDDGKREFERTSDLERRVLDGRKYLEDLLETRISVFVSPYNGIRSHGLQSLEHAGLHLAGTAGVRRGWPLSRFETWRTWAKLTAWRWRGGVGVPWVLDLGGHCEVPGNAVTPSSRQAQNDAAFDMALSTGGVFCAFTHYWELDSPSRHSSELPVGEQLGRLVTRAVEDPGVRWCSVGEVARTGSRLA